MQSYARDALYLWLSELANPRTPSWCIEKILLPMYQGQPTVPMPTGTVELLNLNYRVVQALEPMTVTAPTSYWADFTEASTVTSVGIKWAGTAVNVTFEVSDDNATWTTITTSETSVSAGEWTWTDMPKANPYRYFRIIAAEVLVYSQVVLGGLYQEIPMGRLNRDTFVAQSNKMFQSRPTTYWFQRDLPEPVINLWPAPNSAAEEHTLVAWRHRHIMDVGTQRSDVEVPQRWQEAMVANLAAKLALETPSVDLNLIPVLKQEATVALQTARDGDNDGSSTFIQPNILGYTR